MAKDLGGGLNLDQNCFSAGKWKNRLIEQSVTARVKDIQIHRAGASVHRAMQVGDWE